MNDTATRIMEAIRKYKNGDQDAAIESLAKWVADLEGERDKLLDFKNYVHARLDAAGVPTDPDSPHKAAGCRIGGRLDWVFTLRALAASCTRSTDTPKPKESA